MKKVILIISAIIFGMIMTAGCYNDWAYITHGDPREVTSKIFGTIFASAISGFVFWLIYILFDE